uniref:Olfactory receptor n=1 Tax=Latimeria chalumnae TaxID=7897 RepID=H2ZVG7_LATCH
MDNNSFTSNMMLTMEGFSLTPASTYPAFIIALLVFILIVTANCVVLWVLLFDKKLHEPMYLLFWNMPINDLIGNCSLMPILISNLLSSTKEISYTGCIMQAFCIHTYGGVSSTILAAMAYDRYIAICNPLRYHIIMTKQTIRKINILVWVFPISLVIVLFALALRFPTCRYIIYQVYCDNVGLLKLTCSDTTVNNFYGLAISAVLNAIVLSSVGYSYARILITCLSKRYADAKKKAIQTCATHLLVFAIYKICALFIIISHRIPQISENLRSIMAIAFLVISPLANPIIYGIKSKEIQNRITKIFKIRIVPN